MLGWLASFLSGPIINGFISAYKAKLEAGNAQDALAADLAKKELEAEIAARAAAKEIVIAEQGWWVTAMIRPLFAIPLAIYWCKVILWDKVLGLGTTDPLHGFVLEWGGWIILAYFGGRSIERVAKTFAARR